MKPLLIHEKYTCPLSLALVKEYNKLVTITSAISSRTKQVFDFTGGKVSCADIVAYQIGWGNLLLSWYKAGIEGIEPQMPGEGFPTWDYSGLAKHFYEKYHYDGEQQQMQVFHDRAKQILSIVEKEYQTGNLDKIGIWSWCRLLSGKEWPLSK